jgi:predicted nuclease with RNAse H fold
VTLHDRGGLAATFHRPATVAEVARTVRGFEDAVVAIDAPSGRRLDRLQEGAPARAVLGLPDGRYERMRVCDAMLFRRGLPLYPVPAADEPLTPWQSWMAVGFELFSALAELGLYRPAGGYQGAVAAGHGRLCETYPDAIFCALLGHRPPPKRTPAGRQQRIEVLDALVDADGGLHRRTLDELDACAAAYAAYGLATGFGTWVGEPDEGVIVLPVTKLLGRYRRA